jgi:chromate transporter
MSRPTTLELLKYFLYLGSLGFGGPVALVGYMQRDLVEQRQWFNREASMVAISWLYVRFGGLAWMQAAFYGVGPWSSASSPSPPASSRSSRWRRTACSG